MSLNRTIEVIDLGIMDYQEALILQKIYHQEVVEGIRGDTLLLVEHPAVLTLGKRGELKNLLVTEDELRRQCVSIVPVERGGDITYHGLGQIVGYPIINLKRLGIKVKDYVNGLEEMVIRLLGEEFDIVATKEPGKYTGVWVEGKKIMAIGVEIKRLVTLHGFALNINTNLAHFDWIVPCGLEGRQATSLEQVVGQPMHMETCKQLVVTYFMEEFNLVEKILE